MARCIRHSPACRLDIIMSLLRNLAIFFSFCFMVHSFMDVDLALSFFRAKHLKHNVVLTCFGKKGQILVFRNLTKEKNMLVSVKHLKNLSIFDTNVFNYKKVGIILDGDCMEAQELLIRVSCKNYRVFDTKTFWLVLHKSKNYQKLFKYVNLNVDSVIKVAYPASESRISTNKYLIDDVYNPAYENGGELKFKVAGFYDRQVGYQVIEKDNKYFVRRNLTGVRFRSHVVLPEPFHGSLDNYLKNDRDTQINTFNRFHARLMDYCKDYYNYSVKMGYVKSWGYPQTNGTVDGLSGELWLHKIDFGSSPLFMKKERARVLSYGRKTWNLRGAFFLRNPKSKKSYQIFIKPFSVTIWVCILISSLILVYSQKIICLMHKKINKRFFNDENIDSTWSFYTFCIFGAFCQQGIISYPNSLSGKAVALTTLLLGLLIYQFYSATLVSFLLNVPTTVINTVQDILDNHFTIGCEDVLYVKDILKFSTDNVTQTVYQKLLEMAGKDKYTGFIRPVDGLNLVKKGQYAFQVELVKGYPIIEREFEETMICELKEISMYKMIQLHANYQKWSPFKDLLDVCLQRFGENGVMAREVLFWHSRKPVCLRSSNTIKINTSLTDFYPALGILIIGIASSMLILGIELFWQRKNSRFVVENVVYPYVN